MYLTNVRLQKENREKLPSLGNSFAPTQCSMFCCLLSFRTSFIRCWSFSAWEADSKIKMQGSGGALLAAGLDGGNSLICSQREQM